MRYRGFTLVGQSDDWTAYSSDCEGWGRTKNQAVEEALKERRGHREDASIHEREESAMLRADGYREAGPDEEEEDGTVLLSAGRAWVRE